jgi:hypothetical protein
MWYVVDKGLMLTFLWERRLAEVVALQNEDIARLMSALRAKSSKDKIAKIKQLLTEEI